MSIREIQTETVEIKKEFALQCDYEWDAFIHAFDHHKSKMERKLIDDVTSMGFQMASRVRAEIVTTFSVNGKIVIRWTMEGTRKEIKLKHEGTWI